MKLEQGKIYEYRVDQERKDLYNFTTNPVTKSFKGNMSVRKLNDDEVIFQFMNMEVQNSNDQDYIQELESAFKVHLKDHKINGITTTRNWSERILKAKYTTVREFFKSYDHFIELSNRKIEKGKKPKLEMLFGLCEIENAAIMTHFTPKKFETDMVVEAYLTNCVPTADYFGNKLSQISDFTPATVNKIELSLDAYTNEIKEIIINTHEITEIKSQNSKSETKKKLRITFTSTKDAVVDVSFDDDLVCLIA